MEVCIREKDCVCVYVFVCVCIACVCLSERLLKNGGHILIFFLQNHSTVSFISFSFIQQDFFHVRIGKMNIKKLCSLMYKPYFFDTLKRIRNSLLNFQWSHKVCLILAIKVWLIAKFSECLCFKQSHFVYHLILFVIILLFIVW